MRPPGRAELTALLETHGLRSSRALGQNFLADPNVAERIARLARVGPRDRVVEVGAGLGSLTVALAATGASVTAIELDRHLLPALGEVVGSLSVNIVHADAMACDWPALLGEDRWVLVANLPYNIATPLVLDLLVGVPAIERMLVMVQREAGERLSAEPSGGAYGAVSARVAYFASARIVGRVPPSVFIPRPKVESVLVEIVRRESPIVSVAVASYDEINRLISIAFSVRRKMLRRSLGEVVSEEVFACAGVDSQRRPEELGIEEWGELAGCLRRLGPPVALEQP
ncbi:MAG: 16S rRNA (adenine(1518)-N(6)/adenine(1519)-N(6))-dimethyltransferase RsmA [Acidimicrobiales bacterium]